MAEHKKAKMALLGAGNVHFPQTRAIIHLNERAASTPPDSAYYYLEFAKQAINDLDLNCLLLPP